MFPEDQSNPFPIGGVLTQQEVDDFEREQGTNHLTNDDILWFTHGEKEVRSWLPHMEALTERINSLRNQRSILFHKQQMEMRKLLLTMFETNDLDELNRLLNTGHKLLAEQIKQRQ